MAEDDEPRFFSPNYTRDVLCTVEVEFSIPLGRPMTHEQMAAAFKLRKPVESDPDDVVPFPDELRP